MKRSILAAALLAITQFSMAEAQTIKLGFVGPVTGPVAEIGGQMRDAATYAIDEANKAGGVTIGGKTYKLEMAIGDTEGVSPERAVNAHQRLHQVDKVLGTVGHPISSQVLAILPLVQRDGVPLINTVGKAGTIPAQIIRDKLTYVYQLSPTNQELAASHGSFLAHYYKPKRIALIGINSDATRDYAEHAAKSWAALMPGLEMMSQFVEPQRTDILPELLKIQAFKPDALYVLFVGPQTYAFVDQFAAAGLNGKMIVIGDSEYGSPAFPTRTGSATDLQFGNAVTFKAPITPRTLPFYDGFQAKTNATPAYYAVQTYDGMSMLIEGLRRMKDYTGDLAKDRAALNDALKTITPANPIVGARGNLGFLPLEEGQRVPAQVAIVQFVGGKINLVWPQGSGAVAPIDPRK